MVALPTYRARCGPRPRGNDPGISGPERGGRRRRHHGRRGACAGRSGRESRVSRTWEAGRPYDRTACSTTCRTPPDHRDPPGLREASPGELPAHVVGLPLTSQDFEIGRRDIRGDHHAPQTGHVHSPVHRASEVRHGPRTSDDSQADRCEPRRARGRLQAQRRSAPSPRPGWRR